MSAKSKASMLLTAAAYAEDLEEARSYARAAQMHLTSGPEANPIGFLQMAIEQIREALTTMDRNLPVDSDAPDEKLEKFSICEAQLLLIKKYTSDGLKARTMGSGEAAEILMMQREHRTLDKFSETSMTIESEGKAVTLTPEKAAALTKAIDKRLAEEGIQGGEQ